MKKNKENFFRTKKWKNIQKVAYGGGAAIVILGALFKIEHWPFASEMLILGLGTEALIFFVSAIEPLPKEYDWSKVYPELADDISAAATKGLSTTQELDNMLEEAKIDSELIESLGTGMKQLGEAAGQLSTTADAAAATSDYSNQLTLASKNMESLNAVYKAQLENSANQLEAQNSLMEIINGAMEGSEKLNKEVQALAENMANLNGVYGGMLSAMTSNRS